MTTSTTVAIATMAPLWASVNRSTSMMVFKTLPRPRPFEHALELPDQAPLLGLGELEYLPEELQSEVVFRISTMQDIHPDVLIELEEAMRNQVTSNTGVGFNLGGVKFAAEIINRLDNTAEKRILEEVREIEENISEQIEEQLFVFDDIIGIDDRTMQAIIKEVDTDLLSMALRGTENAMQEKFFGNMSARASGIIKEQMELMGPVRLKDVEKSQLEVVKIVKGLEAEGKIMLGGKGGSEEFV